MRKRTSKAATPTSEAAAEQPVPVTTQANATPVEPALAVNTTNALPAPDAPRLTLSQPQHSYKIDYSNKEQWYVSSDNGKSKAGSGSAHVVGRVVDLQLQVSAAVNPTDNYTHDFRLRLAFIDASNELSELNLSAANWSAKTNSHYITSPTRSLTGALLVISESDEDMRAFCDGACFSIKPGTGRGVFVETSIAINDDRWLTMGGPQATKRVPNTLKEYMEMLDFIKGNFRAAGLFASAQAVTGELEAFLGNTIDV